MRTILLVAATLTLLQFKATAQAATDINTLLNRVQLGDGTEVAKLLPQLEKTRPNDPGILYLRATLEQKAEKAIDLYQRIVDKFPDSEWADDALYRLYQYSYAVGAYRTARLHLDLLSRRYPRSPYAIQQKDGTAGSSVASSSKPKTDAEPARPSDQGYAVQIGAYSKVADAEKQTAELKSKGYTAYIRKKEVNGKQVFAVWIGVFSSSEQARAFAARLKQQQNIDALVVRR